MPQPLADPIGVPGAVVHRDGPGHRLRSPDPHDQRDRLAPHRAARPRRPLPDRRAGDLRGARPDLPAVSRRACPFDRRGRPGPSAARRSRQLAPAAQESATSLGRDQYIHAVEVAKDAIAAGEAIQVVLARRQSFDLPARSGRPAGRRDRPVPGPAPGQPQPLPVLRPDAVVRGRRGQSRAPAPGRGGPPHDAPDRGHPSPRGNRGRGRAAQRGAPARPQGEGRARDAGRSRPERSRPGRPAGHRPGHEVHGGRALQPRPPPRQPRRGPPSTRARCARCLALGLPRRNPLGSAQGPGDAADRRGRERAPRAVWRSRRLPWLRRQPRHGDHDPERRPARRHGPRPHRGGDRGRLGPRARVRGDRAQGRRPPPGDRPAPAGGPEPVR